MSLYQATLRPCARSKPEKENFSRISVFAFESGLVALGEWANKQTTCCQFGCSNHSKVYFALQHVFISTIPYSTRSANWEGIQDKKKGGREVLFGFFRFLAPPWPIRVRFSFFRLASLVSRSLAWISSFFQHVLHWSKAKRAALLYK